MRWTLGLAVLVGLGGCAFEPDGAVKINPPAEFRTWYAATEACSGRAGDFGKIEFYEVPGSDFQCPTGQCVGRWESGHKIYLSAAWEDYEMVVRHEMLHDLIGRSGHPNPPFGTGCPLTWATWHNGSSAEVGRPSVGID